MRELALPWVDWARIRHSCASSASYRPPHGAEVVSVVLMLSA